MPELKIDLHVHTDHSDSISSLEEVLESARKRKLDGIAITDHDTTTTTETNLKQARDLIIIPGIEVETEDGHILILGLQNPPPKGLDSVALAEHARKEGGVVIIAHPNTPFHRFIEDSIRKVRPDAIETHNAKIPLAKWATRKNIKLAERLGLPQTGGSDSHMRQTVGDMYTIVNATSRSVEGVLEAIRRGDAKPAGKPSPIWERPVWFVNVLARRLRTIRKQHH